MAERTVDHLLIGGGIASASCAEALREAGATGSILLVGRELDPPYHRPPITKGYLAGAEARETMVIAVPGDVEVLTRTSVLELDVAARTAKLSTKETVAYDTALLATGAMVRRLQLDGAQLEGLHYLRALGNAEALRADLAGAEHVVCIGGSYIGCEVAATATALGRRCTIVLLEEQPMERGFGLAAGAGIRAILESHGVTVRSGAEVERLEADGDGDGDRIARVVLAGGDRLEADVVVAGVGALPDVMLARKAGLELGPAGGVRADAQLRVAGADGLYVAGDIAEFDSVLHGHPARIEHEEVAAAHGRTVARNMLGAGIAHAEVPYFWSDLADWASLEYVGLGGAWDAEEVDGDPASGRFSVTYRRGDRLVGALSGGGHADLDAARAAIVAGAAAGS